MINSKAKVLLGISALSILASFAFWAFGVAPENARPAPGIGLPAGASGQGPANEPLPWTTRPVRIDPGSQPYARTPPRVQENKYSLKLRMPRTIRVTDTVSFIAGEKRYRLAFLQPLPLDHVCRDRAGRQWACGRRARIQLRKRIAGNVFLCRLPDPAAEQSQTEQLRPNSSPLPVKPQTMRADGDKLVVLDCLMTAAETISEQFANAGWAAATANAPAAVKRAHEQAVARRRGLWSQNTHF